MLNTKTLKLFFKFWIVISIEFLKVFKLGAYLKFVGRILIYSNSEKSNF